MKKNKSADPLRPNSSLLLDGDERAAARAMLYPVGFTKEDLPSPSSHRLDVEQRHPCNMHMQTRRSNPRRRERRRRQGDHFQHLTIRNGISMGSEA